MTRGPKVSPAVLAVGQDSLQTLTPTEAEALAAIVARLIPGDENEPGAAEAGAVRFIDRALAGALVGARSFYAAGLSGLDRYSRALHGTMFIQLSVADQDKVLHEVEQGVPKDFGCDPAEFFAMLREHTIQGTFCDPYYGGNVDYIGWSILGYPGLRMMVTREDQRMEAKLAPVFVSAYAGDGFRQPVEHSPNQAGKQNGK